MRTPKEDYELTLLSIHQMGHPRLERQQEVRFQAEDDLLSYTSAARRGHGDGIWIDCAGPLEAVLYCYGIDTTFKLSVPVVELARCFSSRLQRLELLALLVDSRSSEMSAGVRLVLSAWKFQVKGAERLVQQQSRPPPCSATNSLHR